ncbi:MAG TPA: glycosyltransferase family 4 protein [Jatrophihabitantaceae bacterium]|jgi:alpha-1,6-mannosyltransferase
MRIVQLANFHTPTSGGLRVAVDTLRTGYIEAGHRCTLIVPGADDGEAGNTETGAVRTLRSPKLPNGTDYRVIVRRRAVLALLDELRPDVVEVHDKVLQHWIWSWSRARRVPVVAWSHERLERTLPMLLPFVPGRVLRRATSGIAGRVGRSCDLLVACSRFAADEFGPYAPVRIVRLGVELSAFRPRVAVDRVDRLRLVLAARLSPEKRPDLAVDALRVLHERGVDAELTVLGHGPRHTKLAESAAGLPVRFTGYLTDRDEVAAELSAADVALAPAPAETFGLAALEALACGTPIVAHQGAAPAEIVARYPGAGAAAAGDPVAFADAALRLAAIPRGTRRDAARRAAEAYPWSATISAMLDVHGELLGAGRAAG